jgi:dihydrofolate reductase
VRKLIVNNSITLDGVMQAPGRPDEDRRGGFSHGGWAAPYADEVLAQAAAEGMAGGGAMLFGRRTYEDFAKVWPSMPADNPFARFLNEVPKHVASRTLRDPLPWNNARVLYGDATRSVARLKLDAPGDVVILGSGELVRALMPHHLIDEYRLLIHPLVLGEGLRMFSDSATYLKLRLKSSKVSTTGVIIATYIPL